MSSRALAWPPRVLAVAGEHLIAGVEVGFGDPTGDLSQATTRNDNGRPDPHGRAARAVRRRLHLATRRRRRRGHDPDRRGPLCCRRALARGCRRVACSPVISSRSSATSAPFTATSRCAHAWRRPLPRSPSSSIRRASSRTAELYGRKAWEAALARAAAELDRLARAHGGQAYHVEDLAFALLVDEQHLDTVVAAAEEELADYDGLIFAVGDA